MWKASRIIRWCLAGLFGLAVFPASQNFFVELARDYGAYDHPRQRVETAMSLIETIASDPRYWPTVTFIGGLFLGSLFDLAARRFDQWSMGKVEPGYVETRLKLRLDPSGSGHYLMEAEQNIAMWQQTIMAISGVGPTGTRRSDTFSMVFKSETEYERPIVDTFGHKVEHIGVYALSTKGYVLVLHGESQPGALEIWFPPLGYYDQKSSEALVTVGLAQQPR